MDKGTPPRIGSNSIEIWKSLPTSPPRDPAVTARNPTAQKFVVEYTDRAKRSYMKDGVPKKGTTNFFVRLPPKEFPTDFGPGFPMPGDTVIISPVDDPAMEYTGSVVNMEGNLSSRTKEVRVTLKIGIQ